MDGVKRRTLIVKSIQGLGAGIAAALGFPAIAYILSPTSSGAGDAWIEAGDITKLDLRKPEEVVFRRARVDGWKIVSEKSTAWVVKLGDREVVAFSPQCTHLGCAYRFDDRRGEFVCPCHTSNFSLDGKVLTGPAPRPLDRFKVRLEGMKVLVGELQPPAGGA